MWPIIMSFARRYVPAVTFPIAVVVGVIGYNLESKFFRVKNPPYAESIQEKREERLLENLNDQNNYTPLKDRKFVPKSVFDTNLTPSLLGDDD